MYYVYVLKSLKDGNIYIGQTSNIVNRIKNHNQGKVISTKHRLPLILIGYEKFNTRNEARWFEYNLKKHSDKKYKFISMLEDQSKSEAVIGERPPARRFSGSERGEKINVT